jgi:UDP:flavonoid glycosyltransferase YjiC (YdhE family)
VLAALAELSGPTVVFGDGVDSSVRKKFEAVPTMRFETRRLDMARVREECDLAVLNANHGTLCQLLLGGKPMLQVPLQLEQQILARRVEQMGATETVWNRGEGAAEEIRRKLAAVATEPRYAEAAGRFARKYASFDPAAQVGRMVARVEELIEQRGSARDNERGSRAKLLAGQVWRG